MFELEQKQETGLVTKASIWENLDQSQLTGRKFVGSVGRKDTSRSNATSGWKEIKGGFSNRANRNHLWRGMMHMIL